MNAEAIDRAAKRTRAWMETPAGADQVSEWKAFGHSHRRRLGLAVLYATRIRRAAAIAEVVEILAKDK